MSLCAPVSGVDDRMTKNEFTEDAIHGELLDYTVNRHYPHDALDDVGGKYVVIEDVDGIEIDTVEESGSTFIVKGSATIEISTNYGDGESFPDSYPMKFSYEFDEDGKIVRQLSREIDTSSFFYGDDDYEVHLIKPSGHRETFGRSILDVLSLLGEKVSTRDRKCLHKLIHVNIVTALECYLSDFFISRIKADRTLLRKFIETTPKFGEQKISLSDVFKTMESVENRAMSHLTGLVWHRLKDVGKLYEKTLGISFPSDMNALHKAIEIRHELVHRNGKKEDDTEHNISEADLRGVMKVAEELVNHIEEKWEAASAWSKLQASKPPSGH